MLKPMDFALVCLEIASEDTVENARKRIAARFENELRERNEILAQDFLKRASISEKWGSAGEATARVFREMAKKFQEESC